MAVEVVYRSSRDPEHLFMDKAAALRVDFQMGYYKFNLVIQPPHALAGSSGWLFVQAAPGADHDHRPDR